MASPWVFEVTAESFQKDVLERSRQTPILLDFWAEWCGPCKTLGPILEKVAQDYGGAFLLGKVDSDREQDLAYAFQVSSIPFVVLLRNGKPVDGFTGIVQERDLKAFLTQHRISPLAPSGEDSAKLDPNRPESRLADAKRRLRRGDVAGARSQLEAIPDESEVEDARQRLLAGLEWLEADLAADPAPAAAQLLSARKDLLANRIDQAMDTLLASIAEDRGYRGELARKAMLVCLELHSGDEEAIESWRRRLATALY